MKVLIISFLRRVQHFTETLLLIPRPTAEALYGRHFAQMKSPQNNVKHEPYTYIMLACATMTSVERGFPLTSLGQSPNPPKGKGTAETAVPSISLRRIITLLIYTDTGSYVHGLYP